MTTTESPKPKMGRPASTNPRSIRLYAAVTEAEAEEVNALRGPDSVSDWVRDAILTKLAVQGQKPTARSRSRKPK